MRKLSADLTRAALVFVPSVTFLFGLSCGHLVSDERKADAAEGAYLAEQLKCVDDAKTLAESRACRNMVKARWRTLDASPPSPSPSPPPPPPTPMTPDDASALRLP